MLVSQSAELPPLRKIYTRKKSHVTVWNRGNSCIARSYETRRLAWGLLYLKRKTGPQAVFYAEHSQGNLAVIR